MPAILIDTGPIVAALHKNDEHHAWAVEQFKTRPLPFLTCEAVLTEVAYVLYRIGLSPGAAFDLVISGGIVTDFDMEAEAASLKALLERYDNVPMDVADACMVRMSELHSGSEVLTLDSDFTVYRRHRNKTIPLITP